MFRQNNYSPCFFSIVVMVDIISEFKDSLLQTYSVKYNGHYCIRAQRVFVHPIVVVGAWTNQGGLRGLWINTYDLMHYRVEAMNIINYLQSV